MEINFIHWDIDPEIVSIMGFPIRYYGLLFASGVLLCIFVLNRIFRKENISLDKLDTLTIYGVIGIFMGARLGHCLFYDPSYYFDHPLEILLPIKLTANGAYKFIGYQGLASHGGIAGLILALILYSRRTHVSIINTIDLVAVVAPLAGVFALAITGGEVRIPAGAIAEAKISADTQIDGGRFAVPAAPIAPPIVTTSSTSEGSTQ